MGVERIRSVTVTVNVETNECEHTSTLTMGEDETLVEFLDRIGTDISEWADIIKEPVYVLRPFDIRAALDEYEAVEKQQLAAKAANSDRNKPDE